MVAQREYVGPGTEEALGEPRRDPGPVGHVLRVDDAEARAELVSQAWQALLDRRPAGRAEDVCDEEDLYGNDKAAAGWTERETWFPASCV